MQMLCKPGKVPLPGRLPQTAGTDGSQVREDGSPGLRDSVKSFAGRDVGPRKESESFETL